MKQAISGAMANRKGTMKIGVQNSTKKPPKTMLPKIVTKVAQNRLQGESGRCLALVREGYLSRRWAITGRVYKATSPCVDDGPMTKRERTDDRPMTGP
jgi:hypothetical protein